MTPTLKVTGLKDARAALQSLTDNLKKELAIVTWKVGRKAKSLIAKDISQVFAVAQKVIRSKLKANKIGNRDTEVILEKSSRIPIDQFRHTQTRQGVTAKLNKGSPRYVAKSAFKVKKWGGVVRVRKPGVRRAPTVRAKGPSPWGVFVTRKRVKPVGKQIQAELHKQLHERVRYLTLKKQGVI